MGKAVKQCTSSTVIQSGPGAEFLFEFFMACFMCVMFKKISKEIVWFSSKTESISSSISCLNSKSNSFFPIFSMWNFWSFSDIFLSSKMCRPDSVSQMGSTMLFVSCQELCCTCARTELSPQIHLRILYQIYIV